MPSHRALAPAAARTVVGPQCGFVQGRRIEDDVLGLDGCLTTYSIDSPIRAAALILDFANTFPSLSHAWLFAALVAMRIPRRLLNIIRGLYRNLVTQLDYARSAVGHLYMQSGIRQACPPSRYYFCVGPRALHAQVLVTPSANTHIFCYADDIAIVDVMNFLPCVARALRLWRLASGLTLKGHKCVVIPVWDPPHNELHDIVIGSLDFAGVVASSARYMGVDVGPGSCDTSGRWCTTRSYDEHVTLGPRRRWSPPKSPCSTSKLAGSRAIAHSLLA